MTHGSLFSGIGGFDYAAEIMGWENVFHCELEPFARRVLNYYWPKSKSYEDIKQTDFTIHRGRIDVLSGGFPCQPFSVAGKRKGTEDERNLWPEMYRAIQEIRPRWVVGENVPGIINWNGGLVFEQIHVDLEVEGYEVQSFILPAASVNAPHRRDRVWFIAYTDNEGHEHGGFEEDRRPAGKGQGEENKRERVCPDVGGVGEPKSSSDSKNEQIKRPQFEQLENREPGQREFGRSSRGNDCGNVTDANRKRRESGGGMQPRVCRQAKKDEKRRIDRINHGWKNFPQVEPTFRPRNDGFSAGLDGITLPQWRTESLKAAGNAIVPQVAIELFKTIELFEQKIKQHKKSECQR
jgi:DNA (cytosine-5)-methyltransferase 1